MALPNNITDREYQKFVADNDGNTSLRTSGEVTDGAGHTMAIDAAGRASTIDGKVQDELSMISSTLNQILIQLQMINGV